MTNAVGSVARMSHVHILHEPGDSAADFAMTAVVDEFIAGAHSISTQDSEALSHLRVISSMSQKGDPWCQCGISDSSEEVQELGS